MKWSDFFKALGLNMDEEMEKTDTQTVNVDKKVNKNDNVESSNNVVDKKEDKVEEVKTEEKKMVLPKYDTKTGLFDIKDVDNEELKALLKLSNDTVKGKANTELINKAIADKMSTVKLVKGISNDLVLGALDRSGIKVTDGKVTGVDEAFDSLMTSQSGLFVADKGTSKSNPLLEGFNPQNNVQQGTVPNSFVEAFSMME